MLFMAVTYARRSTDERRSPSTYEVRDRMDSVLGYDFAAAEKTLIVWVNSGCKYCTESMGFYRRLTAAPRRAKLLVMGREAVEVITAYLEGHGVRPDAVVSVPSGRVRLYGTPTLVLVSGDGIVQSVWLGKLGLRDEDRVLRALQ